MMALMYSCGFGDINVNPALPSDVSAQAIVPAAQAGMAFAIGGEAVRINGLFMQQFNDFSPVTISKSRKYFFHAHIFKG